MNASNNISKIDSVVLGNYILNHYGHMSHLKLQKLLYYCDAYHLAYFDEELMEDHFEAWVHGPVSRKVFAALRDKSLLYSDMAYDGDGSEDAVFEKLTSDQRNLITEVLEMLKTWTGLELERATHEEIPWIRARAGYDEAAPCHVEISKEDMRVYYKKDL